MTTTVVPQLLPKRIALSDQRASKFRLGGFSSSLCKGGGLVRQRLAVLGQAVTSRQVSHSQPVSDAVQVRRSSHSQHI